MSPVSVYVYWLRIVDVRIRMAVDTCRYEITTLNKNLLYLSIITTTLYEAAKNVTTVLKTYYEDGSEKT